MERYVISTPSAKATWIIIGVNTIIGLTTFAIQLANPRLFEEIILSFSAIPFLTILGRELYRLITSMFLHGDLIHLFLNMLALFIFGPDVERVLGRVKYLILYFASGIAADYTHAYFILAFYSAKQLLLTPSIGASGAIFGVMAAYALLFPLRRVMFFMWFPVVAPAIVAIIIMALLQVFYAFLMPFSQVAYAAHLGGFIAGLIITLIYKPMLRRMYVGL
jgi:membrane associated rhomboid family serine protease